MPGLAGRASGTGMYGLCRPQPDPGRYGERLGYLGTHLNPPAFTARRGKNASIEYPAAARCRSITGAGTVYAPARLPGAGGLEWRSGTGREAWLHRAIDTF